MHTSFTIYAMLFLAIILESLGTSYLEKSKGFTLVAPIVISLVLLATSFVLGGFIVKTMPIGIYYAVWSGIGIILTAVLGYFLNRQALDTPALIGMVLIAVGVAVIHLYSKSGTV